MSDSELVSECLKGNSSAQRTLFQLHSGKMFAVCLRYMGSTMEAEDVLQESFIKVFEKAAQRVGRGARFLGQGTLYPDVIESVPIAGNPAALIKSHHNVGGLPKRMKLGLVEPLRQLFKDEEIGRAHV